MLVMPLTIASPAMAQGLALQIQGIHKGVVTGCSEDIVYGFIEPGDFEECIADFFQPNVEALLESTFFLGQD